MNGFSNLFTRKNKILLRELVITDFKLRYQGSALGYLWSVLKPLFLFTILYIVFDKFLGLGRDIEHFAVYLLLGIVVWQFFSEATIMGLQSIISRGDLIRKINFPKYIIVVASTVSALINLLINIGVVLIFCLINNVELTPLALLVIPLLLEIYVFALGLAFLLSAINVKLRDIGYLWEIFLQGAFYATPILYPLHMILAKMPIAAKWLMLNPMAQAIQDLRYVLVTKETITIWALLHDWKIIIPFVIIIAIFILGVYTFSKNQKHFAEEI